MPEGLVYSREALTRKEQCARVKECIRENSAQEKKLTAQKKQRARKSTVSGGKRLAGDNLRSRKARGSNECRELTSNLVVAGCMRSAIRP